MYLILIFCLFSLAKKIELYEEKPLLQEVTVPKILVENQTLRLNCALIQGGRSDFVWLLNDEKLKADKRKRIKLTEDASELIIRQISIEDLGNYKCVASNAYGEDVQKVSLFVNG